MWNKLNFKKFFGFGLNNTVAFFKAKITKTTGRQTAVSHLLPFQFYKAKLELGVGTVSPVTRFDPAFL